MNTKLKTREVASKLEVSQKVIRKWINYFGLNCEVNESGHYIINRENYNKLVFIHEQLTLGKRLNEITLPSKGRNVSSEKLDERFNKLLFQIDELDRKIQTKAGEVVEYQMLQHRKEIDEITDSLEDFNQRLQMIEAKLNREAEQLTSLKEKSEEKSDNINDKKGRFASIFSF